MAQHKHNCYKCKKDIPLTKEFFTASSKSKTGFCNRCRDCARKDSTNWRSKNRDKVKRQQKDSMLKRIKEGKCCNCNSLRMINSNRFCEKHYFVDIAKRHLGDTKKWEVLVEKLKDQNFKCVYTGTMLVIGLNDSIDHRLPLSKYPKLKNNVDNLQWVTREVNLMKSNISEERFLLLTEIVANHQRSRK